MSDSWLDRLSMGKLRAPLYKWLVMLSLLWLPLLSLFVARLTRAVVWVFPLRAKMEVAVAGAVLLLVINPLLFLLLVVVLTGLMEIRQERRRSVC